MFLFFIQIQYFSSFLVMNNLVRRVFYETERITNDDRSGVDFSEYPIFKISDEFGVEEKIDVVEAFEISFA